MAARGGHASPATGLAVALVALVALAGCGGGDGGDSGPLLPVEYHREFGGITGGIGDMRVEADGRGTVKGGQRCGTVERRFRLSDAELDRLRSVLEDARGVRPRERLRPGVEAPAVEIDTAGFDLRYAGLGSEPEAARPLVAELDRIMQTHCLRFNP